MKTVKEARTDIRLVADKLGRGWSELDWEAFEKALDEFAAAVQSEAFGDVQGMLRTAEARGTVSLGR